MKCGSYFKIEPVTLNKNFLYLKLTRHYEVQYYLVFVTWWTCWAKCSITFSQKETNTGLPKMEPFRSKTNRRVLKYSTAEVKIGNPSLVSRRVQIKIPRIRSIHPFKVYWALAWYGLAKKLLHCHGHIGIWWCQCDLREVYNALLSLYFFNSILQTFLLIR